METIVLTFGPSATYLMIAFTALYTLPEFRPAWWFSAIACAIFFIAACYISQHTAASPLSFVPLLLSGLALWSTIVNWPRGNHKED